MSDWLRLAGKRVLVAGGGGLGVAIAQGFVEVGASVFIVDNSASVLAGALAAAGAGARGDVADVSTPGGALAAVDAAVEALGGLDVFIHAIGINRRESILEIQPAIWQKILDVNLTSFLWLAKAARPHLPEGGKIVAISSVSGLLAHPHHGAYAATKGGLNQLVRVMAIEWAEDGVTVNAIAPAYTITPLTESYVYAEPGRVEELTAKVPMKRLGRAEDVVGPTLLLASSRADYVTGQVVYIDGGRTVD